MTQENTSTSKKKPSTSTTKKLSTSTQKMPSTSTQKTHTVLRQTVYFIVSFGGLIAILISILVGLFILEELLRVTIMPLIPVLRSLLAYGSRFFIAIAILTLGYKLKKFPGNKEVSYKHSLRTLVFVLLLYIPIMALWINHKCSNPKSRYTEDVIVKEYTNITNERVPITHYDYMIVEFKDGCQLLVKINPNKNKYQIGTHLPVTIERGLLGLDVVVEYGFDNDEHSMFHK